MAESRTAIYGAIAANVAIAIEGCCRLIERQFGHAQIYIEPGTPSVRTP